MPPTAEIEGVTLTLAHPDELPLVWVGAPHLREQLLASWLVLQEGDVPLSPRIVGRPGVGKTTLGYSVAASLKREVYIVQCTMDMRPEDLIVTPVLQGDGRIAYHASGVVSAMIRGGVCILDEGNRMSEKSWASLAALLDMRRYVESVVAGIKISAHPDFRLCVTMNDDASTFDLPEYIASRLKPVIEVGFPTRKEEEKILQLAVPFAPIALIAYVTDFLQKAHSQALPFTSRDGVHIVRYALKMAAIQSGSPEEHLLEAIESILGEEGLAFIDSGTAPANASAADIAFGSMTEIEDDEDDEEYEDFESEEDDEAPPDSR